MFGGFSLYALISGVFLFDSMISAYNRATQFLNRAVLDKVTDQFREPAIKKTISEVASREAKQVLAEQIEPEVRRFQSETAASIDSFKRFTTGMELRYTGDYQRLSRELVSVEANGRKADRLTQGISATVSKLETSSKESEVLNRTLSAAVDDLRRRKSLTDLGGRAITDASRPALRELSRIAESDSSPEIRLLALSEVMRVKAFWLSVSRTADARINKEGKEVKISELKTCEVLPQVLHNPSWIVRAVLVGELGGRRDDQVPETLLQVIESDENLEVVKDAVLAWDALTRHRSPDVFGLPFVETWWKDNGESFRKNLTELKPCS